MIICGVLLCRGGWGCAQRGGGGVRRGGALTCMRSAKHATVCESALLML
jgi:hypothetical protein